MRLTRQQRHLLSCIKWYGHMYRGKIAYHTASYYFNLRTGDSLRKKGLIYPAKRHNYSYVDQYWATEYKITNKGLSVV
jgi:hypothetical protein